MLFSDLWNITKIPTILKLLTIRNSITYPWKIDFRKKIMFYSRKYLCNTILLITPITKTIHLLLKINFSIINIHFKNNFKMFYYKFFVHLIKCYNFLISL